MSEIERRAGMNAREIIVRVVGYGVATFGLAPETGDLVSAAALALFALADAYHVWRRRRAGR